VALNWVIAGGGTGGHVTLALALAEAVQKRGDDLLLIGTDAGLEARLVPMAGFQLVTLPSRQVMGRNPIGRLLGVLGILRAGLSARRELRRFAADVVISVGGYAALPAALAAILTRTPLALVEPNSIPGRSNRLTARFAARVFTGFESAAQRLDDASGSRESGRVRCLGVPLRRSVTDAFAEASGRPAPEAPYHLLIFGGSQGAQQINDALVEAAPRLAHLSLEIFHQSGAADCERLEKAYAAAGVPAQVVAFEDDMPARYRWAHLAVSRAGALSVAELTMVGLPALLVPYPWAADDHQTANARELEDAGAARRLAADAEHHLSGDTVADAIEALLAAPEDLAAMSAAAFKLARPGAASDIVEDCAQIARAS